MSKAADRIRAKQALIEAQLDHLAKAFSCPPALAQAMSYSLLTGGKRFRPLLVLASAELAGLSEEQVLPMACALEMIHTYSLIHDDLPAMDDDELRRGKPTNHVVHGEAMAILTGDALLNEAMRLLLAAYGGTPRGAAAALAIAEAAGKDGMIGGQVLDLAGEGTKVDLAGLEAIHRGKTGALITCSLTAPQLLAGSEPINIEELRSFGDTLGIFFQIQDDCLDVEADAAVLGKTIGKDARDKKSTYVSILGLAQSKARLAAMETELLNFANRVAGPDQLLPAIVEIFARRNH